MKLKDFIETLKHPDHLPEGQDPMELEVEFFTGYLQPASLLSVYVDEDGDVRELCIDIGSVM